MESKFVMENYVKETKRGKIYTFRCSNCGKRVNKTTNEIKFYKCNGCKIYDKVYKFYEMVKDEIIKKHKCIGYDVKYKENVNRENPVLIFECVDCKETKFINIPAKDNISKNQLIKHLNNRLSFCDCINHKRALDEEEVGDFIIAQTDKFISNSGNVKYKAVCKHCGHTIQGQHSHLVKLAQMGCSKCICIDGKYIKTNEYKRELEKEMKTKNKRSKIKQKDVLDMIYRNFKLYRKIHERIKGELENLTSNESVKKKYKEVLKDMAKDLQNWCEQNVF